MTGVPTWRCAGIQETVIYESGSGRAALGVSVRSVSSKPRGAPWRRGSATSVAVGQTVHPTTSEAPSWT